MMPLGRPEAAKSRFYAKVLIPDENGCMIFRGAIVNSGYGKITINKKQILTHRFSYLLHIGSIPKGMLVLHKCDVRNCVAPDHLFLGNTLDNTKDMIKKGRARKNPLYGENHHTTTLNNLDVVVIKKLLEIGCMNTFEIAKAFSVNRSVISSIRNNRTWNHIT